MPPRQEVPHALPEPVHGLTRSSTGSIHPVDSLTEPVDSLTEPGSEPFVFHSGPQLGPSRHRP